MCGYASGRPTPHKLEPTEQNRDWLRASRCLSRLSSAKQRTDTDQPAPINGCGGGPFLIQSRMSKINCRRQVLASENPAEPGRHGQKVVEQKVASRRVSETKSMLRFFILDILRSTLATSAPCEFLHFR